MGEKAAVACQRGMKERQRGLYFTNITGKGEIAEGGVSVGLKNMEIHRTFTKWRNTKNSMWMSSCAELPKSNYFPSTDEEKESFCSFFSKCNHFKSLFKQTMENSTLHFFLNS